MNTHPIIKINGKEYVKIDDKLFLVPKENNGIYTKAEVESTEGKGCKGGKGEGGKGKGGKGKGGKGNTANERQVCHHFSKPSGCKNGDKCKFYHSLPIDQGPVKERPICRYFAVNGECQHGESCHFRHVIPPVEEDL